MNLVEFMDNHPLTTGHIHEIVMTPDQVTVENNILQIAEINISNGAENSLLNRLGIPSNYAKKFPADLMLPHIQHLLDTKTTSAYVNDKRDLLSFDDQNRKPKFNIQDLTPFIEEALSAEADVIEVKDYSDYSGSQFSLYTYAPGLSSEPREGDIVNAGLAILGDPIRDDLEHHAFLERLVCSNGMIHTNNFMNHKKRRGATLDTHVSQIVTLYSGQFEYLFDQLKILAQTALHGNKEAVFNIIAAMTKIGKKDLKDFSHFFDNNPEGSTMWDFLNVVTNSLTHNTAYDSPERRFKAYMLGGKITEAASDIIRKRCHSCKVMITGVRDEDI